MRTSSPEPRPSFKLKLDTWRHRLNQPPAPTTKLWRYGLLAIIVIFSLTALIQSLTVPIFEGSDEPRHYAYARYLVNNHALPPQIMHIDDQRFTYGVGQEAGQPPLYYLPVALLTALAPNADDAAPFVVHNNFIDVVDRAGLPYDNHNYYLHGAEGDFPFQGVALAVHLGRLVSVAVGVCTLLAVYALARTVAPNHPAVALLATALIASVPGFIYVNSVITNDVAVILFTTLGMWVALRIARTGADMRLALLGGLFAGLATLSKVNGAWVAGIVWLAIVASAVIHRPQRPLSNTLALLLLSAGVWLLITGWWFAFNLNQLGDPFGLSIHEFQNGQSPLRLFISPQMDLWNDLLRWETSAWYAASWSILFGPGWIYQVFRYAYLVGLIGALGLCVATVRHARSAGPDGRDLRLMFLQATCLGLAILLTIAGCLYWQLVYGWRLGRLLYPGLTSVAVLAALGWGWWLDTARRSRRLKSEHSIYWAFAAVAVILLQGAAIASTVNTLVALWPHAMLRPPPADVTHTQVTFLDPADGQTPVAEVTGYRVHPADLRPDSVLYADICWKSQGYTQHSFPYSMQLVGPNDIRPGTRNSYHGLGSYPMSAWKPGEEFCDPTSLHVDFTEDRPRAYKLMVTLFEMNPVSTTVGPPLAAIDGAGRPVYPVIGRVRVAPAPRSVPVVTPVVSLGGIAGLVNTQVVLQPDDTLSVTVRWVALNSPDINAKVFMHVIDAATGAVIAQSDHEPDDGWFPTNYWLKGDVVDDHFEIKLPAATHLAEVNLLLGMYNEQSPTQERLPAVILATHERFRDDAIPVAAR